MAEQDVDYGAVFREVGFEASWAVRGAEIVENEKVGGRYRGFRSAVNMLSIGGASTVWQPHHIEPVIRRVEAQEAAQSAARRATEAAAAAESRRLDEQDELRARVRELEQQAAELAEFRRMVSEDELDGRVAMRPHVAEAFRRATGVEPQAPRRATRPSWEGRAPGPKRVEEVVRPGQEPAAVAGSSDLVEGFRELGLSEEAAQLAAKGR